MEFKKEDAEALLAPCGLEGDYEVHAEGGDRQAGVWPAVKFDRMWEVETNVMRWRPAQVFADDPDPPDVARTPSLPFPFTERQLAAFMLDGVGALVSSHYGDWVDGPVPERLDEMPREEVRARAAVKAAFNAYREAKKAIGCRDDEWPDTGAMVRELLKPTAEPQAAQQDAPACTATLMPAPKIEQRDEEERHVRAHRNLLTPVIEAAQRQCKNPFDTPDVWAALVSMAANPKPPLLGPSEDGIKWRNGDDDVLFFSMKNLRDRLKRMEKRRDRAR